ncbi:MAG: hypothetical protein HY236_05145 [Acidobacteria bacterium]|nr:hypothetical protein [Acidobacteriota bacterium]
MPVLVSAAALRPIGFARSESDFTVGSSVIQNNSTIFEGDDIGSLDFAIRLNLKDGSRYTLGADSEGNVYQDHLLLRSGSVEMANTGQPSRVLASSLRVAAEAPASSATVYLNEKGTVTVLVRKGEVKVTRGRELVATLGSGQLVSFKSGSRGAVRPDTDGALIELNQAQAEQVSDLAEAAKEANCLLPRVEQLSYQFDSLSTRLAAYQASRSAIQTRFERGIATQTDQQMLTSLNNDLRSLTQESGSFSADLNNVIFQHHYPGSAPVSPHTIHGHIQTHCHHGQHGHTVFHLCPTGEHQVPPHHTGPPPIG